MLKIKFLFLILVSFSLLQDAQSQGKIVILHTNDLHSHLEGFSPESQYTPLSVNDDKTSGGFARIAAVIKKEKANVGNTVFVVDAGDFLMGTLFHTVEASHGFQLPLMKMMGYDAVCLGNHEFDFGIAKLYDLIKSSIVSPVPQLLLGNAVFNSKDPGDDPLEELFQNEVIKRTFIIERDGIKAGFFSLLGINAIDVAPYSAPLKFEKQIRFARKAVMELKQQGCNIIICLSHSGLSRGKNGAWEGEDYKLAQKVKGIDLIVSGHTHTVLDKPLIVNGTVIVQTGEYGNNIGRVTFNRDGQKVTFENYELIPVDDRIAGDEETEKAISEQKKYISGKILSRFGLDYSSQVAETSVLLDIDVQGNLDESNLGPFVADAIYYYINKHSSAGADVAMVSAGIIRDKVYPGIQTPADIFRVMPLGSGRDDVPGYPFSRLYVTGRELKNILEILLVAAKSNSDYYCFFSGIRAQYNPDKGLLRKVINIEIVKPDGTTQKVDFSKKNKTLYSITANSYMLEFIGIIKQKSFGLINVVPKNAKGEKVTDMTTAVIDFDEGRDGVQEGKEWQALVEYLKQMKDEDGNGIPDVEKKYHEPVQAVVAVK